jgi:hypothetical protein
MTKPTILTVDDDPGVLASISLMLLTGCADTDVRVVRPRWSERSHEITTFLTRNLRAPSNPAVASALGLRTRAEQPRRHLAST